MKISKNFLDKEIPNISNTIIKFFIKMIRPFIYWWTMLAVLFYWSIVNNKKHTEKKLKFWRYFCIVYVGIIILIFFLCLVMSLLRINNIMNYFLHDICIKSIL